MYFLTLENLLNFDCCKLKINLFVACGDFLKESTTFIKASATFCGFKTASKVLFTIFAVTPPSINFLIVSFATLDSSSDSAASNFATGPIKGVSTK